MLSSIATALAQAEANPDALAGVGVGFAGLTDHDGTVVKAPNLAGWNHVHLRAILEQRLRVPVAVGNDANVAAVAEHQTGAGLGCDDIVYLAIGTGIGAGVIVGGRLVLGDSGVAGEAGHMVVSPNGPRCACGNSGCLEALASGSALEREARSRMGSPPARSSGAITAPQLFEAAARGDPIAREIVAEGSHFLGVGLANLVNLLDPKAIIIGGGLSHQWEGYIAPAIQGMNKAIALTRPSANVQVLPAGLGDRSVALGALALAQDLARGAH
jgi:glucokinase